MTESRNRRSNSVIDCSENDQKWECSYCTYHNFQSATKCTICRMPKPLGRIEDAARPDPDPCPSLLDPESDRKWSCTVCTYKNWPRSIHCVQCHSSKAIHVDTGTPPTHRDSAHNEQRQISPPGQNEPSTSKTIDSRILAKKLQKWTCVKCTYENWPKAHKCVLCYSPRFGMALSPRLRTGPHSPGGDGTNTPLSGSESPKAGKRTLQGKETNEGTGRKSPKSSPPPSSGSSSENIATAVASALKDKESALERQLRYLRNQLPHHLDFLWLTAVRSVAISSCDCDPVEAYLSAGGDPTRALTNSEVQLLESSLRGYHFDPGHTLIHLALGFHREDLVPLLVASTDPDRRPLTSEKPGPSGSRAVVSGRRVKRVPCHVSPDTAADIRRLVAMSLRQRKGEFPCFYFTEYTTFCLPCSIYELTPPLQQRLFDEILDRGVQKELEEECSIINWSLEITDRLCSRLYALWNRTAGDCLLDSVLQATWGVFDSENSLRQALSDSLVDAGHVFYPRWREYETVMAKTLQFSLDESQFARDWDLILRWASKPGSALEKVHVFALAHIIRRPIIVYGVRIVKSYRGEHLDYARFEGVYLPLLWESTFCSRSPICLGYTLGHFVALIPMEPNTGERGAMGRSRDWHSKHVYLPLQDADGKMLPVHFLTQNELGHEQSMLRTWLDATVTDGGVWCCKMKLHQPPALVDQMIEDWLDYYRRLGQMVAFQQQTTTRSIRLTPPLSPQSPTETVIRTKTESKTTNAIIQIKEITAQNEQKTQTEQNKEEESSSSGEDSENEGQE